MKKKSKAAVLSPVEVIRQATLYGRARDFFGSPFQIVGGVVLAGCALGIVAAFQSGGGVGFLLSLLGYGFGVLFGLFLLSIPILANAVFDIADCALRADAREARRESKVAYDAYRQMEGIEP